MKQNHEHSDQDIDDEEILDYEFLHAIGIAIVALCVLAFAAVLAIYSLNCTKGIKHDCCQTAR